jgi:endoglucanase
MDRRSMMSRLVQAGVGFSLLGGAFPGREARASLPEASPSKLPRWRGFNLLEMFYLGGDTPFREKDFALIRELGFNFVRLPLDYRCWTVGEDWTKLKEEVLKRLDKAVELGKTHEIHVQLNFHRAPGYTVAQPAEKKSLWTDSEAQDVCALHWGHFARRFQGIPSNQLSFNLFNEPADLKPEVYRKVVERMVTAIHEHDRDRLIVCDGRGWGRKAPTELVGLGVAAATRGYDPFHLTHYKASWVQGSNRWSLPIYPLTENGSVWDRKRHWNEMVEPWKKLEKQGVGVMVGEFGSHNRTPHEVVIPWMRDCLANWKEADWGWALWNFSGSFGILDSDRADVSYESWNGHKLDRAMLEVLQAG